MEHLGETSNPFQGTILYGSVTGAIGKSIVYLSTSSYFLRTLVD